MQYYTDPVSGYVFRSMKDVTRYLETGELGRLAFKPREKGSSADEFDSENDNDDVSLLMIRPSKFKCSYVIVCAISFIYGNLRFLHIDWRLDSLRCFYCNLVLLHNIICVRVGGRSRCI